MICVLQFKIFIVCHNDNAPVGRFLGLSSITDITDRLLSYNYTRYLFPVRQISLHQVLCEVNFKIPARLTRIITTIVPFYVLSSPSNYLNNTHLIRINSPTQTFILVINGNSLFLSYIFINIIHVYILYLLVLYLHFHFLFLKFYFNA